MMMEAKTNHNRIDDFGDGFGESDIIRDGAFMAPSDGLVGSIGKLGDDWNHELSPIAPDRDSFNGNERPKVSAISLGLQNPEHGEQIQNISTTENKEDTNTGDMDNHDVKSPALSFKAPSHACSENGVVEKQHPSSENNSQKTGAAWFLAADHTSPLSTSSEFSLESLISPHTDKSVNEGTLSPSPKEQQLANEGGKNHGVADLKDACKGDDCRQAKAAENCEKEQAYLYMEAKGTFVNGSSEKMKSPRALTQRENDVNEVGTNYGRETTNSKERPDREKINSQNTSSWREDSEPAPRLSTLSSDDVLVQDATEKVKKFIYELSLSSSRLSIDAQSHQLGEDLQKEENYVRSEKVELDGEVATPPAVVREYPNDALETMLNRASGGAKKNTCEPSEMASFHEGASHISAATMPDNVIDWSSPVRPHGVSMDAGLSRTPGSHDLSNAKKELGASSYAFLNQVRGAAQRRKQNFTKSRDSLFAKEQKQREEIAASKMLLATQEVLKQATSSVSAPASQKASLRRKSFKAKSVPVTNGVLGSGGLTGVPKVAKKQPTIPSSPLLGARRLNRPRVKALKEPNTKPRTFDRRKSMPATASLDKENVTFKARPAPPTTGQLGRSGQAGVPKVPKRPVTVPSSPCLGPRRKNSVAVPGKENLKQARRISTGMFKTRDEHKFTKASPMSTHTAGSLASASPVLLGLEFLSTKSCSEGSTTPITTPQNAQPITSFEPQSTIRAKKRAEFEARRALNERNRIAEDIEQRENRLKELHQELDTLREVI